MSENEFRNVVQNNQDRVYNTCLGFLKSTQDAEDIAQEVFIQVYKSYDTFLAKSNLSTWIYKITVNKCLEEIRKKKSTKRNSINESLDNNNLIASSFYHPGVTLENKEKAAVLMQAIEMLPENQRIAFTLNKIEGLSYEMICKIMDKSISSVESLLHRSKTGLKELLKNYYEENRY